MPVDKRTLTADDFFPHKEWRVLGSGELSCSPTPTPGCDGVEQVGDDVYRVTTRAATRRGMLEVTLDAAADGARRRDADGLLTAARPLLRRPGLPRPGGQDLRLGPDPQRAPDPVLRRPSSTCRTTAC